SVTPGAHVLRVKSAFGTVQQTVTVSTVSPGIFLIGSPAVGAIENYPNFSINAVNNPVSRGQAIVIYATGLGAVTAKGGLSTTNAAVTVLLNGTELPVSFSG